MTYKEAYAKCKTLDELKEKVKDDILIASLCSLDRKDVIEEAVTETLENKGWKWVDE